MGLVHVAPVECIHTYSLIHDDLPAMDNDDFRRGKPTNHKVFGEGIAVLAGDALLTQAFEIAAQAEGWPRYSHQALMLELTKASGSLQLIAGQVADLEAEGKKISAADLKYIHERKTSALLCCSVRLGGMSANCTPAQLKALTDFGYNVGPRLHDEERGLAAVEHRQPPAPVAVGEHDLALVRDADAAQAALTGLARAVAVLVLEHDARGEVGRPRCGQKNPAEE